MEHSFISMRLRTRPGPAVNGHGVIPDPSISMMDSFCHVITGLVPVIPMGEARCSSDRDGHDRPAQASMHGWVEANFTRNGPKRDLEPFFRAI
jgi:hypothetical protein